MGQVIQTNGDYNIKARSGGTITLDSGPNGQVAITGNLLVQGSSTTVQVENLEIQDNIIVVNKGETGGEDGLGGVTLTYAGLKVDRGPVLPNTSIIWDESISSWALYNGSEDGFVISSNSKLTLREIRTDPDAFSGNLFINVATGVIEVPSSALYESKVVEDYHIPNKRYVDQAILNNPSFQLKAPNEDSYVIVADKDIPSPDPLNPALGSLEFHEAIGFPTYGESVVSVIVDNNLIGQFFANRFDVGDLEFGGGINRNEITSRAGISNENIFVRTQGTGKLQTNYSLQFDHISGAPGVVSNASLVYGKTPGLGTSGVWFVNNSDVPYHRDGELISKNKALVFSMIF